jgi:hypothetical protein
LSQALSILQVLRSRIVVMVRLVRAMTRDIVLLQMARSSRAMTRIGAGVSNDDHAVLNAGITSFANHSNCSRQSDNGKPKG